MVIKNTGNTNIIFMGTPEFAVPSLQALSEEGYNLAGVVTQPDRPKGRGRKLAFSPVKEAALELKLEVFQPARIRDEGFNEQIKLLNPDLIVVVAFGQILPASILDLPPLGCINVHASLLPSYRGAAPIHRAILNGETESGVTTMLMDKGLDTGDILLKEKVVIPEDMTFGELHDILALKGAALLLKTVELWKEKKIEPLSQKGLPASYAPLLKREDELILWENPVTKIYNQIRGLEPWPGAYTYFKGTTLKIRRAEIYNKTGGGLSPGTVVSLVKGKGFVVQTGQGRLLVSAVQPYGKNIMTAGSFVNGYRLCEGYRFNSCQSGE